MLEYISVPVVAAGGIVDGRGMAAAMVLGAEGVQLGTRFVVTEECIAHPNYKHAIVEAGDSGTIVTRRGQIPSRSLKTKFTMELAAMEKSGTSPDRLREFIGRGRARKAQIDGDLVNGDAPSGSSAGLIKEILPASVVVENLVKGCHEAMRQMHLSQVF